MQFSPNAPLRIGVAGMGHLGKFHAENWAKIAKRDAGIRLTALCDPAPAGAAEAKKYSAPFFSDYRELDGKVANPASRPSG